MSYTDYDSEVEYYSRFGGWLSDNDSTNESSEKGKKDKEDDKEEEEKEKEEDSSLFNKINILINKINEYENRLSGTASQWPDNPNSEDYMRFILFALASARNLLRSASGIGINPLSAKYPSGPHAFSLVNSLRNPLMPGILSTCAFFT